MAVAVSKALEDGAEGVVCASTGNTAASAAAYAARAGLAAVVLQPGRRDRAREARAGAGGRRARARGPRQLRRGAARLPASSRNAARYVLVNSLNPHRIEGQKTAAFEIVEELGGMPDVLALPYGGGGNTVRVREGIRGGGRAARGSSGARRRSARSRWRRAIRIAEPVHRDEVDEADRASGRRRDRDRRRRRDLGRLARAREPRRHLLRAVLGRRRRGARARRARARQHRRLRPHRATG